MEETIIDKDFQQLIDFVFETNQNIFLTGKAGTGKTTALRYIKTHCKKQLVVAAPTGVAAINAGGTTIHSLFQFPFHAFLPNNPRKLIDSLKYNEKRLKLIRDLELLIIDEVSMVRADMLDAIDVTLRSVRRRREEPFGGVQLLLIGDMFQLPPVVRNEEWTFLSQFYESPYFFDSQVLMENKPTYLELKKVYRQKDQKFIDLLNNVRNNELTDASIATLNECFDPKLSESNDQKIITLTTHNHKADGINTRALQGLKTKSYEYKAEVKGNFPEKNFPVNERLVLKEGARVMFVKNDQDKRYFNGLIGEITKINSEAIFVKTDEFPEPILVKKEIWENINYTHNKKTNQIEEEKLGDFEQYPLRLAWAITIHKSQGLTFDNVVIDAQEAFSAGQVYVALSRCRSLEGLKLKSKISQQSLKNDQKIVGFSKDKPSDSELEIAYKTSKKAYHIHLIRAVFNFNAAKYLAVNLETKAHNHLSHLTVEMLEFFKELSNQIEKNKDTADKFDRQLAGLYELSESIEENVSLQERIKKAAQYFTTELNQIASQLENHTVLTESKMAADDINPILQELWLGVLSQKQLLRSCLSGFSMSDYLKYKLELQLPTKKLSIYATKPVKLNSKVTAHQSLLEQLYAVRQEIIEETNQPIFMIASKQTLEEMVMYLPQNSMDLLKIKGFGKAKVQAYGERFLDVIVDYCEENNLSTQIFEKEEEIKEAKPKKEAKKNTKEISLELFKTFKNAEKVAKERSLSLGTIEGHLGHFVLSGELDLEELIPLEKQEILKDILLKKTAEQTYQETMEMLPEGCTYNQIRLMQNYLAQEGL